MTRCKSKTKITRSVSILDKAGIPVKRKMSGIVRCCIQQPYHDTHPKEYHSGEFYKEKVKWRPKLDE